MPCHLMPKNRSIVNEFWFKKFKMMNIFYICDIFGAFRWLRLIGSFKTPFANFLALCSTLRNFSLPDAGTSFLLIWLGQESEWVQVKTWCLFCKLPIGMCPQDKIWFSWGTGCRISACRGRSFMFGWTQDLLMTAIFLYQYQYGNNSSPFRIFVTRVRDVKC